MRSKDVVLIMAFLIAFSTPASAEKVLLVDFTINANDSATLNTMMLVDGKVTHWAEGNYKMQLLDSSGKVVDSKSLPIEFFISGIGEVDAIPAEARLSNYADAKKVQILKDSKVIFEASVALCNNDKVCDKYENSLSCPSDCPTGSDDKYCDREKDRVCDPNCAKQADEDCKSVFDDVNPTYIVIGMALIVFLLILFFKKKANAKDNVLQSPSVLGKPQEAEKIVQEKPKEHFASSTVNIEVCEPDPRLIEWINKQLAEGHTQEQLNLFLIKHGYSKEIVEKALSNLDAKKTSNY